MFCIGGIRRQNYESLKSHIYLWRYWSAKIDDISLQHPVEGGPASLPLAGVFCKLYAGNRGILEYTPRSHDEYLQQANQLLLLVNYTPHLISDAGENMGII